MTRRDRLSARDATIQDPARYSPTTSVNRVASLRYALAGCRYMLRHQKNTRIQLAATILVSAFALALGISADQWAILILAIGSVWIAEFINAAIEAAVNLAVSEIHPMAKVAKDVAAAAVLLSVLAAVFIGLLIFGPPMLDWMHANSAGN